MRSFLARDVNVLALPSRNRAITAPSSRRAGEPALITGLAAERS